MLPCVVDISDNSNVVGNCVADGNVSLSCYGGSHVGDCGRDALARVDLSRPTPARVALARRQ